MKTQPMFKDIESFEMAIENPHGFYAFAQWYEKYLSPEDEKSILKGIPNTAEDLEMVSIFRKLVFRKEEAGRKTVIRLKSRGARACHEHVYGSKFQSHLPHHLAKTFALYIHIDYVSH